MAQVFQSTEGIILKSSIFGDYDQILSLFTPQAGVIKIFVKGSYRKYKTKRKNYSPLTLVEIVYREKKSDVFSCYEIACKDYFSSLREKLLFLEVACDFIQSILTSQLLGKTAPQLYMLFCSYLKKIPQLANPWVLAASFRLKLLKHDGLIFFPLICSQCDQILCIEAFTRSAEGWCALHRPEGAQNWSKAELEALYQLTNSQSLRDISFQEVSPQLQSKIQTFFDICLKDI